MSSDVSIVRRAAVCSTLPFLLLALHALPVFSAAYAFLAIRVLSFELAVASGVGCYLLSFPLIAGMLSLPFRHAVIEGRFPRDLGHRVYGPRRLYAACWTTLYYHPVVHHVVLALPWLKTITFRLFGYKGNTNFTVYPDTWIRDLPLLDVGEGAYLANRATIGTNICLRSGDVMVGRVQIGARSMIGHLAVLGPDNHIGSDSEVGVGTTFGMRVSIGDRTRVGAIAGVNHGASIGCDCVVDSMSYVGLKATLADGTTVRSNGSAPDRYGAKTSGCTRPRKSTGAQTNSRGGADRSG